jgi:two-component system NtrC family sensor kinase
MSPGRRPTLRDWFSAMLAGAVAAALRTVAQPVMGDQLPFVVAYPAVVFASLMWGTGPGLITALMCAAAVVVPQVAPGMPSGELPVQVGGYLIACIVIALLCGQLGRTRSLETHAQATTVAVPETPLTVWLRAVLWGAFLIPATVFVVIAWWGFDRAQREADATAARAADLLYRHAQRTFMIAADIASRADKTAPDSDEMNLKREAAIQQRLSDMTAGVPAVVNLNLFDARGQLLSRSDQYPLISRGSIEDRAYFRDQIVAGRGIGISEVVIGRQSGLELINVALRRSSADGSFRGIVTVALSPDYFREYYRTLGSAEENLASFALIRTDGETLARWPTTPDEGSHIPPTSLVLKQVAEGTVQGSLVLPATPGQETRLVSFKRVANFPLYVEAGFSRAAMFASWYRFLALLAAILVPTTALLVYVSWVALKRTRREQATAAELQEQTRRRTVAERNMLESQKLETLAVVTGGVAHDFNNLLAIVNTSLHVLKRRHPGLAEEKQVVSMTRAIQSGVRLTRQLLSFSRKQALRPETVNLQSWLPATEALIQTTLGPNITWQAMVEPGTLPIKVDLGELELALINLVVNARHAMPKGGALSVRAGNSSEQSATRGSMVTISVQDSGVGIPPELLAKVLEPFFTTRERGSGSGLGLSQVNGFCIQAGGFVRVDSVVGEGTTVVMHLPADRGAAMAVIEDEPVVPVRLTGRVLLVEDNDEVASTTEMLLRTTGLDVLHMPNADAALAHLASAADQPDAVLSDIAMPGSINGIGLAIELRKRRPALPVLLTSGYAEQLGEANAIGLRVLPKPVAPDHLLAELRAVLPATAEPVESE